MDRPLPAFSQCGMKTSMLRLRKLPAFAASIAPALAAALLAPACGAEERTVFSPPPLAAELGSETDAREIHTRGSGSSFEQQVLELVNQERGSLPPLKGVNLLDNSSETHSSNMATRNFHMHCDPDTFTSFSDRITAAGYSWNAAAENIAAGYPSPAAVMAGWMASPGHAGNILHPAFRELGVGYVSQGGDQGNVRERESPTPSCSPDSLNNGPYTHYWTQNFGLRNNVYPAVIDREAYDTSNPQVDLYLYGTGWAQEMRLRNETGPWSDWLPFSSNLSWILSGGDGVKTVNVELRNGGTVRSASDSILLSGSDFLFGDGFESADTSAWSLTVP